MKRIEDFYLPGMSQQQAFIFFQKVYHLMEKIHDTKLQARLKHFSNTIMTFDIALKSVPNNHLAEKIAIENNSRYNAFKAIYEEADMLSAENNVIGEKIKNILSSYSDVFEKTDEEKTGLFNNLMAELENQFDEDSLDDDIQLFKHISLLRRSNWTYKQYLQAYKIELTGRCLTYETLRTRKEAEEAYKKIAEFIDAMLIYNGDAEHGDIIDQINHVIGKNRVVEQEIKQVIYA